MEKVEKPDYGARKKTEKRYSKNEKKSLWLDGIAKVHKVIEPERLKEYFPEVELEERRRLKEVEHFISHRKGRLASQRKRMAEDLVLW